MAKNSEESVAVRDYFEGRGLSFDTLYGGRRNAVMRWLDRNFRRDIVERFRLTFEALGDLTGKTVLDVGCGSGPYIIEALARGAARVVGVDVSANMLALARRRVADLGALDRVKFVEADFATWPVSGKFDATIVMGVMDYVGDARDFMEKIGRTTFGRAVVSFPSVSWWRSPIRRVRYILKRCPLYLYSRRRVEEIAAASGAGDARIIKIPGAGMDFVVVLDFAKKR